MGKSVCVVSPLGTQQLAVNERWDDLVGHFRQYLSYIVAFSFVGGGNGVPGENHRPVANR